ncbi:MAG TPA: hypothetical protein VKZ78_05515, partial [Sphingobacteriaceae bacterium]|nr:hypothetical protein [Sphingobacteriaceae bacterium]
MIHPDGRTHIFYDENNHYFSNIDPGQFLYALRDGHPIPLSQVEAEFFNPEKILELFGTPDQSYLTTLQRALRLRQDHGPGIGYVADGQVTATLTTDDQSAKPNLYLLSIGVSDYQDPAYDLTLSDKDAMDMVKIYGNLDPDQTRAYYDQFFGTKYTLYNQDNEPLGTINNYAG